MVAQIRETERVRPVDELGQGDIIRIDNSSHIALAPRLGIVINADCDLAHGKTDGTIAYLPVYTFREYLEHFWAQAHVDEIRRAATMRVLEILGDGEEFADNLDELLRSLPRDQLVNRLAAAADLKRKDRLSLAENLHKVDITADETRSHLERFFALCRNEREPQRHARKQISEARRAMGEGHFVISEILDQPEVGFVVRMRRIWTIPVESCFNSVTAQRAGSDADAVSAARLAKLTPLYRFRVLQIFAQQYSRIGLPDEVTALGDLAIDDLVECLAGTT